MTAFSKSLGGRVFLLTAAIVALALVLAVGVAGWIASAAVEQTSRRALERARAARTDVQRERIDRLRLVSRLLVTDPYIAAYIAEAAESGDSLSILDLLSDRQADLGIDLLIALDPNGRVLARTDQAGGGGRDLSGEPLVRGALEELEAFGVWHQSGALYDAVAVPIAAGSALSGFLIAGVAIDDVLALEVQRVAAAEMVVLGGTGADVSVVASTLDDQTTRELVSRVETGGGGAPLEVTLRGRRWLTAVDELRGTGAESDARVIALVSIDELMAPYRRMRWAIAITGVVAALLAAAALFVFVRRALRPVGRLADGMRAAVAGRYDVDLGSERDDEVGELAHAFDQLLRELREQRDMVEYLGRLSRTVPSEDSLRTGAPATGAELSIASFAEDETLLVGAHQDSGVEPDPSAAGGDDPSATGDTFGDRFELLAVVGEGGMGVVYKARDLALDETVALKALKPELKGRPEWEQLKEELKLARSIAHPNVLRTYDFGNVDGVPFITMEYVRGVTLRHLLRKRGPLPHSAGLHLARQLCRGLAAVHAEGIVHRDVKPGNILVEPSGNAKLMDFGIAKATDDSELGDGEAGMIVGTPDYQAPEQVAGEPPTPQSDIYAFGLVIFETFAGDRPFDAAKAAERMLQRLEVRAPLLSEFREDVPDALAKVVARCLRRKPADRYRSASELLEDLDRLHG